MKLPPLELLAKHDRDLCEQYAEQQAKAIPMGRSLLCRVLGKYLLYTDPVDVSMTPHLAMLGHWEMWVTMAIARNVPRGGVYFDVGAAYGYYTVLLADLAGEGGKVLAFEPNERLLEGLEKSVVVNGFHGRVRLSDRAVDKKDGTVTFHRNARNIGASSIETDGVPLLNIWYQGSTPDTQDVSVAAADLDGYLRAWYPQFIKIDVEGAELRVWDGMREMRKLPELRQVLLELTPRHHPEGGLRLLREALAEGFALFEVGTEGQLDPREPADLAREDGPDLRMVWLRR